MPALQKHKTDTFNYVNMQHRYKIREIANAEFCDNVGPSWFCGERLLKSMHWITMVTGALSAGEQVIIIAYITVFSIPLSQGVACPGHCHSQQ